MIYEIKKDAWYSKLVFKTWTVSEEDFTHMCPFFWLTVFTVLIFPLSLFILLVKWGIKKYFEICEQNEKQFDSWAKTYYNWLVTDNNVEKSFLNTFYKEEKSQLFRFFKWLRYNDYDLYYKACDIYNEHLLSKNELKDLKQQKRKDKIAKAVVYTKPISKFILYTLAISSIVLLGFLLQMFIVYCISLPSTSWLTFFVKLGKLLAIVTIIILVIIGTSAYLKKKDNILNRIFGLFYNTGSSIYNFISLFFQENCPPIKWK